MHTNGRYETNTSCIGPTPRPLAPRAVSYRLTRGFRTTDPVSSHRIVHIISSRSAAALVFRSGGGRFRSRHAVALEQPTGSPRRSIRKTRCALDVRVSSGQPSETHAGKRVMSVWKF